ncbi:MAG: hypothetical protein AAFY71_00620 [Bacteroidota bacterium]
MKKFTFTAFAAFAFMFAMTSCTVEDQILPSTATEVEAEDGREVVTQDFDTEAFAEDDFAKSQRSEASTEMIELEEDEALREVNEDTAVEGYSNKGNTQSLKSSDREQMNDSAEKTVITQRPRANKTSDL